MLLLEIELVGPVGASALIDPCELVGPNGLPIDNVVTIVGGISVVPEEVPGEVTIVSPPFTRGDCSSDGAVGIGDEIFLAGVLFSVGSTPACESACQGFFTLAMPRVAIRE